MLNIDTTNTAIDMSDLTPEALAYLIELRKEWELRADAVAE